MAKIRYFVECIAPLFLSLCLSLSLYADDADRLPPVVNLSANNDSVITIDKPSNAQFFSVQEVVDFNKDGYDDIIALGILDYVEKIRANPCVYLIYGGPNLPAHISIDNPNTPISVIKILWDKPVIDFLMFALRTGDMNGDGNSELILSLPTGEIIKVGVWAFHILKGRDSWSSYTEISNPLPEMVNITAPSLTIASISPSDKFFVTDMNRDGMSDLVFNANIPVNTYWQTDTNARMYYILYGSNDLPMNIDVENTTTKITKILQDSVMWAISGTMAIGDVNRDTWPDLLIRSDLNSSFLRNRNPAYFYAQSYLVHGALFLGQQFTQTPLDLSGSRMGFFRLKTDIRTYDGTYRNVQNSVSMGDINGDGYDDPIITFSQMKENNIEFSKIFVLFGNDDYLGAKSTGLTLNIDEMSTGLLEIFALKGLGTISFFGDVNGDGFKDFIFGGGGTIDVQQTLFILYGNVSFPDSMDLRQPSDDVSVISGGTPAGIGDTNADGLEDIICQGSNQVFIVPGRNAMHRLGQHIVQPVPVFPNSPFTHRFVDKTSLSLNYVLGHPAAGSEWHVTNFGRQLPDSLNFVPTTKSIVSIYHLRLPYTTSLYKAVISIGYSDSLVKSLGIPEKNLIASCWWELGGVWARLISEIDSTKNIVSFVLQSTIGEVNSMDGVSKSATTLSSTENLSLFALVDSSDHLVASIEEVHSSQDLPLKFELFQNYPNPFNPTTIIRFQTPKPGNITLTIYNVPGQEVKTLINKQLSVGQYEVQWDGTDNFGNKVSSGIYIYRIETSAGNISARKMLLLK